jgi:hypothetical protein
MGGKGYWTRIVVPLDSSYEVSNFMFRFHFTATSQPNTSAGWYIDDICVAPGGLGAYQNDFEASNGGYSTSGTTSWAWGAPTSGPYSAHSGSNVWATNLSGDYSSNENGYLTSPAIDLSHLAAEPSIDLRWWWYLYSEPSYDFATVEVSANGGGSWTPVWGPSAGVLGGWQQQSVILSTAYAVSNFRLRFHFTSDSVNNYPGWYVDDVSIQGTTIDSCAPTTDTPNSECQCNGTGPGGTPISVSCGQSACGSDYQTYACSASGWSATSQACGVGADAGAGADTGVCQCSGTGPGGIPITVSCGQSACGSDNVTYSCSASGWSGTGQACQCSCSGTGPGGVPVTVFCGQSACGSDYQTYACSASGWSGTGSPCQ